MSSTNDKGRGQAAQAQSKTLDTAKTTATDPAAQPERTYRVIVCAGAKRTPWGAFASIEAAAQVASKLRQHGMVAIVEATT